MFTCTTASTSCHYLCCGLPRGRGKNNFDFISQNPAPDAALKTTLTLYSIEKLYSTKSISFCLIQQPQTSFLAVLGCIPCCTHSLMRTLRLGSQLHAAHQAVTPAPMPLAPNHLVVPHSFASQLRSSRPPHTCTPHRPELHGAHQALVPPFPCRRCGAGPAGPAERRQRGESSPLRPAPPGPPLPRASAAMRQQGPRPPAALRRGVRKGRIIPGSPGPSPSPVWHSQPRRSPPLPAPAAAHLPARRKGPTPPPPSLL